MNSVAKDAAMYEEKAVERARRLSAENEALQKRLKMCEAALRVFLTKYDYNNSLEGVEDPTPTRELEQLRAALEEG